MGSLNRRARRAEHLSQRGEIKLCLQALFLLRFNFCSRLRLHLFSRHLYFSIWPYTLGIAHHKCVSGARPIPKQISYFLKMLWESTLSEQRPRLKAEKKQEDLAQKTKYLCLFGCWEEMRFLVRSRQRQPCGVEGGEREVVVGGLFRACFFPASPAGSGLCSWTSCLFVGIVDQTLGWPRLCWPSWPRGPNKHRGHFHCLILLSTKSSARLDSLGDARLCCGANRYTSFFLKKKKRLFIMLSFHGGSDLFLLLTQTRLMIIQTTLFQIFSISHTLFFFFPRRQLTLTRWLTRWHQRA